MKRLKAIVILSVLITAIFVLSACNSIVSEPPQNLKYNGSTITWNAVDGVDYYLVQINDGEERKVTNTSLSYNASEKEFTVKVTAISELKQKLFKSKSAIKTFSPLANVRNIAFREDGTAYWDAVDNASAYIVMVNGKEQDAYITETEWECAVGQNTIKVRPIVEGDNNWYSNWSDTESMTKLGTVTNIVYNNDQISWTAPTGGAFGYEVYVNGVKLSNVSGTSAQYEAQNTNFEVAIKSLGNYSTTYDSSISNTQRFVYLDTVSNITVTDGVVSWPTVNGADRYIVKVNNKEYSVETNAYSGLSAGINSEVSIKAISNDSTYFSNFCVPKNIRLLPPPQNEWISGHNSHNGDVINSIQWQEVLGAKGYKVKILFNGVEVDLSNTSSLSENTYQFAYSFLDVGEYKVYVKATAEGSDIYDSVYGDPITVTRLPAPKAAERDFVVSDDTYVEEGFRVNFTKVVGATGYQLYKDNGLLSDYYTTTNQFLAVDVMGSDNQTTQQKFTYTIRTKGSVSGSNVKLDSLPVEDLSFEITIQAMPTRQKMNGYSFEWDSVSGAQYNVKVGTDITNSLNNNLNLDYIEPGTYMLSVNSKGNGTNILPSVFTSDITLTRFSAVKDLYVTTNQSEGELHYTDLNTLAPTYRNFDIFIDGDKKGSANVGSFVNINGFISTAVSNVFVRITANSYDINHPSGEPGAIYYMSSPDSKTLTLAKLATVNLPSPGSTRFTNTQFLWNAPSNHNANGAYSPSYIVYKGAENAEAYHNGVLAGEVLDITSLVGRTDPYNFAVKAIGDGTRYLNSDLSDIASIIKLPTPNVGIDNNAYQWKSIANASAYSVYINDIKSLDDIHKFGETYSFLPIFTSLQNYQIKIYAIGDNGHTSIDSDSCYFTQKTKKLSTPEFSFNYSHTAINVDGTINFSITEEAKMDNGNSSTRGYIYSIGGATNVSEEILASQHSRVVSTAGKHRLSVRAIGGDFDGTTIGESAYYIASDTIGGGDSHMLTLLGKLNSDQIQVTMDKLIKWNTIVDAISYEYEYVFDNNNFTDTWTNSGGRDLRTIDLSALWEGKQSVTIRIRAVGNGTSIITGAIAEKTLYFS